MPSLPPAVNGLPPQSVLNDDDLVLAESLLNRGRKGLVRAVALHVGLPGKNEQVLGVILSSGNRTKEEGKK